MNTKCTLLLNSYDGGEDCWHIFFKALRTQWPEMDLPIVLNTESKKYSFSDYKVTTFCLYPEGKSVPWGKRLIETLEHIQTEYILFFLEDNWIDRPVDDSLFRRTIGYMDDHPDIAVMYLKPLVGMENLNIEDGIFPEFELRPQKCAYKLSAQVAVWRREKLIQFTRPHESPWEWEWWGSIRASRYPDRMYILKQGVPMPFSYVDFTYADGSPRDGVIHRGQWDKEMIDKFSRIYDLSGIDFSVRGFIDWEKWNREMNMTIWEKLLEPNAIRRACHRFFICPFRKWLSLR